MDYFDHIGLHQGYMPEFAEVSQIDLIKCASWHCEKNQWDQLPKPGKTERLRYIQEAVEMLRKVVPLASYLSSPVSADPELANQTEQTGNMVFATVQLAENQNWKNFEIWFRDNLKQKQYWDVLFEIMEWNNTGVQLFPLFWLLWAELFPAEFLKTQADCAFLMQNGAEYDDEKVKLLFQKLTSAGTG